LWATNYWKCLFDSLCRKGSRHDPRREYPDLKEHLEHLIEERAGRFHPRIGTALCEHDDDKVRVIRMTRVAKGKEEIAFAPAWQPITSSWTRIESPFFGTPGDSKYEAQSKSNQEVLGKRIEQDRDIRSLGLSFTLSQFRKDRDLDNLYDGLVKLFNKLYPKINELLLVKETPRPEQGEVLGVLSDVRSQVVAKVVAINS
jgi:hypothetical protein